MRRRRLQKCSLVAGFADGDLAVDGEGDLQGGVGAAAKAGDEFAGGPGEGILHVGDAAGIDVGDRGGTGLTSRRWSASIQEAVAVSTRSCRVLSRAMGTSRSGLALVRSQPALNPPMTEW